MIKIITTKNDFKDFRNKILNQTIGLVPTMGNLHEGHISLLKKSIEKNDISIITIFVNPKQFGPNEDFEKYPRTLDNDLSKIENLLLNLSHLKNKEVIVFAPKSNQEIYPDNFSTLISIGDLKTKLCGKFRPIHFDGVTTVVYQLFNLTKPKNVYFGQKDFQQCIIIKKLIHDLEIPVDMHIMPIIRNSFGLALSSRNQYLSETEMTEALHLPKVLSKIEQMIKDNQDYSEFIAYEMKNQKWDYLEVLDARTLENPKKNSEQLVIIAAMRINQTRLLDNILVNNA